MGCVKKIAWFKRIAELVEIRFSPKSYLDDLPSWKASKSAVYACMAGRPITALQLCDAEVRICQTMQTKVFGNILPSLIKKIVKIPAM